MWENWYKDRFKEQNRFRYKDEDKASSMYDCLTHLCYEHSGPCSPNLPKFDHL